jgi:hypothetical protein
MTLIQTFETSISNKSGEYAGRFIIVPRGAMAVNKASWEIDTLKKMLNLSILEPIYPLNLSRAVASLLRARETGYDVMGYYKDAINAPSEVLRELFGEELLSFVEQLCFFDLVPLEESPFDLEPFAKLFTKASKASALGAFAGWVIAGGTVWILVTMPACMIIFGAASGIAQGLEEGLRVRIGNWLKGGYPLDSTSHNM